MWERFPIVSSASGRTSKTRKIARIAAKMELNASSVTMKKGQSTSGLKVTMAEGDYIQSVVSSKVKIVSASVADAQNGVIRLKGKKKGKAKVTITLASGMSATVTVKVQPKDVKVSSIRLSVPKNITMKAGESLSIGAKAEPFTAVDKPKYKTSNKKVAAVNKAGIITAKKPGKAKITVKVGKKKLVLTVRVE